MIYSLSNFQLCITVSLAIVTVLHLRLQNYFAFIWEFVFDHHFPIALTPPPMLHSPTPPFSSFYESRGLFLLAEHKIHSERKGLSMLLQMTGFPSFMYISVSFASDSLLLSHPGSLYICRYTHTHTHAILLIYSYINRHVVAMSYLLEIIL